MNERINKMEKKKNQRNNKLLKVLSMISKIIFLSKKLGAIKKWRKKKPKLKTNLSNRV